MFFNFRLAEGADLVLRYRRVKPRMQHLCGSPGTARISPVRYEIEVQEKLKNDDLIW